MRGKVADNYFSIIPAGITPAHAGKSRPARNTCPARKDHPRPCGEKSLMVRQYCLASGSPPPMRGKGWRSWTCSRNLRITPAHAGKRLCALAIRRNAQDHPRPCGEKTDPQTVYTKSKGSPPPMRGKGRVLCFTSHKLGITPAHAGKSNSRHLMRHQFWDHPRPCGEKFGENVMPDSSRGSPPPMRGKGLPNSLSTSFAGITPAHAGKRLRKRRNTGIFVFQISRFHSVSHTPDTSYGNRPALYVRRLPRTPAALQASKAYDRARWAAYAWLFAVCPHTGS